MKGSLKKDYVLRVEMNAVRIRFQRRLFVFGAACKETFILAPV